MAVSNFAERVRATILAALVAALVGGPAQAYQTLRDINQAESRDPSGRITTEASVIHVVLCDGPDEDGGQYYVYQYTKRTAFRAILPPNWGSPIGGRDFAGFAEAAGAACRGGGAAPNDPIPFPQEPIYLSNRQVPLSPSRRNG
jgi:hypothetical protein